MKKPWTKGTLKPSCLGANKKKANSLRPPYSQHKCRCNLPEPYTKENLFSSLFYRGYTFSCLNEAKPGSHTLHICTRRLPDTRGTPEVPQTMNESFCKAKLKGPTLTFLYRQKMAFKHGQGQGWCWRVLSIWNISPKAGLWQISGVFIIYITSDINACSPFASIISHCINT